MMTARVKLLKTYPGSVGHERSCQIDINQNMLQHNLNSETSV